MKILQIITEAIQTSTQLGNAFSNDEWTRILNYFYTQYGRPTVGSQAGDTDLTPDSWRDNQVRNSLGLANERIGAGLKTGPAISASEWNARAERFGAALDVTNPTWDQILSHLAAHKNAEWPEGLTPGRPLGSQVTGHRSDMDRTPENLATVSAWARASADPMNKDQAKEYLGNLIDTLLTNRSNNWRRIWESRPEYADGLKRAMASLFPNADSTASKQQIDSQFYGWLTTTDFDLNLPPAQQ